MSPQSIDGMTVFNSNKVDTKKQPMFFGQPLGVQRYDSYKYPVFEKLTQQQIGYFWQPEESVAWVKGTQARGRLFWSWMRATPEWMDDQLPWKLRIVMLTTVFSSLGFVFA